MKQLFENLLPGWKTYIVAIAGLAYGIGGLLTGNLEPAEAYLAIQIALTAAGLRAAK